MTERDSEYERWQMALNAIQEVNGRHQLLLKSMQSGFHTLSHENASIHQRLTQIEAEQQQTRREVHAMDMTFQQLLPHMAAIAAYVVSQRLSPQPQPQERQRNTRRPNGG
jgi:hypothetical protein